MTSIFVSYSHDSDEHAARVAAFVQELRGLGFECMFDQSVESPHEGWGTWTSKSIASADFVLIVCTEGYTKELEGRGGGRLLERNIIAEAILRERGSSRFIPVVFDPADARFRPLEWTGSYYELSNAGHRRRMFARLSKGRPVDDPSSRETTARAEGGASTGSRGPRSTKEWKTAVAKLTRVLAAGPKTFVEALAQALGVPATTPMEAELPNAQRTRAKQTAIAIDKLGHGLGAAKALMEACCDALFDVDDEHPEDSRSASALARDLVFEWLPRRWCGDGTQVTEIERLEPSVVGSCTDLDVRSTDELATEIHVADVDLRGLGIEQLARESGGHHYVPTYSMPLSPVLRAEMMESKDAVMLVADDLASQVPVQLHQHATPEDLRERVREKMRAERRFRKGRYLVNEKAMLSDDEQSKLKKLYPALRIVNLTGGTSPEEAYVVDMLKQILQRLHET